LVSSANILKKKRKVSLSPAKDRKKESKAYKSRALLSDYRMSILSITAMNNAVQVIRVALLSDIRNVVSYTKKGGSTWLPV
jgi:hypothetical protein